MYDHPHDQADPAESPARRARVAILLLGLILPQVVQLWPSLTGRRVFLPLDVLNLPYMYSPDVRTRAHDELMSDPVVVFEVWRRFTVAEVRAGRLPLWNPHGYAGYPHVAANQTAVFSPYRLIDYAWPGPEALAWTQIVRSCVAGAGMYLFLRRALRVRVAAALGGAGGWPLAGFLSLWAYFPHGAVVTWLGWVLLAVDQALRRPRSWWGPALAFATACALLSGHAATAGQTMLIAATYGAVALVRLVSISGLRAGIGGGVAAVAATLLGGLLSLPQTLPTLEYARESARLSERMSGRVEAETSGAAGLAQLAFPFSLGSTRTFASYGGKMNLPESPAAAHAGAVALLALAPMALLHAQRRAAAWLFLVMASVCLLPALGVPGVGRVLAIPPLSLLHHTRWSFATGFAVLVLASIGTDWIVRGGRRPAIVVIAAAVVCTALGLALAWQAMTPPQWLRQVYADAESRLAGGRPDATFRDPTDIARSRAVMRRYFAWSAATAFVAAGACVVIGLRPRGPARRGALILPAVAAGELAVTFWGHNAQSDRSLYYPPVPALAAVASQSPGRVCGVDCLPANLAQAAGLYDIRGYDAQDPAGYVELLERFRASDSPAGAAYARVQWFVPQWGSPLARMLGLRYWIARGDPPPGVTPSIRSRDYWVIVDPRAMPRAFVPRRVEVVNDDRRRLALLARPDFDPAAVAYLEADPPVPTGGETGSGQATISEDLPGRVVVQADLQSPGLLVLADRWDAGWVARSGDRALPIVRANHVLRGVMLPAGRSVVAFSYEPASFRSGVFLAACAAAACGAWALAGAAARRVRSGPSTAPADRPA